MQALAIGDLSKTVNGQYSGEFDDLKQAVNISVDNLSALVKQISSQHPISQVQLMKLNWVLMI